MDRWISTKSTALFLSFCFSIGSLAWADFRTEVIEEINLRRDEAGVRRVNRQDNLMDAAQWMAEDAADRGFLDKNHKDSKGRDLGQRLNAFGYYYQRAGEVLARGYSTPKAVVQGWMDSPPHKKIILNPKYEEVGSGYEATGKNSTRDFWCVDFGTR